MTRFIFKILCAVEEQEPETKSVKKWCDGSLSYYEATETTFIPRGMEEQRPVVIEIPVNARSLEEAKDKISRYFAWELQSKFNR